MSDKDKRRELSKTRASMTQEFYAQATGSPQERRDAARAELDKTPYRRVSPEGIAAMLARTEDEFKSGVAYGGEASKQITKGGLGARWIAALQGDIPPDQLLTLLDGGIPNGFFYNLIYGNTRGTQNIVGWEQGWTNLTCMKSSDQHEEILKRYGMKSSSIRIFLSLITRLAKLFRQRTTDRLASSSKRILPGTTPRAVRRSWRCTRQPRVILSTTLWCLAMRFLLRT